MTHQAMISANAAFSLIPDVIYTFADGWNQACALATKTGAGLGQINVHRFPDGETLVQALPLSHTQGRIVALYRSLDDPNAKLAELMLAADAVRSLGAEKVILIAPYLPYMRQDRAFASGQAVSQAVVGKFLATYFDAVITIQPHLHRTRSLHDIFGETPAVAIGAGRAIATYLHNDATVPTIVVGPDEESEGLVRDVVDVLGASWFTARKKRNGDADVHIELPAGVDVTGHPIVIVDDIASSGGTIAALTHTLKAAGAAAITVAVVHALFDQRGAFLMRRAGVSKIISVSTIPHMTNAIPAVDLICTAMGVK